MKALLSIWFWIASAILTIILFFIVLLVVIIFPFDKKRKIAHRQCFWWAYCVINLNPFWKLQIKGLENIDHNKTYVVIVNHQSLADIVVLYWLRMQFKWVSKESLFKVPFIGWCLSLTKHIKLERGEYSSIKKVYREAAEWLRRDMSVLFFPEGTRSQTDAINVFQNGAFKLAIKEKKPILPVRIKGTRDAISKGSWIFNARMCVTVTVLPAVDTYLLNSGDFAGLRDDVYARISSA